MTGKILRCRSYQRVVGFVDKQSESGTGQKHRSACPGALGAQLSLRKVLKNGSGRIGSHRQQRFSALNAALIMLHLTTTIHKQRGGHSANHPRRHKRIAPASALSEAANE